MGAASPSCFIVTGDDAAPPAEYAVLGEVGAGEEVLDEIESFGLSREQSPTAWVYIEGATVVDEAVTDEG